MIEDVYYTVDFGRDRLYEGLAYYALDSDDAGRLDEFIGDGDVVDTVEEVSEADWGGAIDSGEYTWYTAYPPTGHAFWFLAKGEPVDHDPEVMDMLLAQDIENYEEYQYMHLR